MGVCTGASVALLCLHQHMLLTGWSEPSISTVQLEIVDAAARNRLDIAGLSFTVEQYVSIRQYCLLALAWVGWSPGVGLAAVVALFFFFLSLYFVNCFWLVLLLLLAVANRGRRVTFLVVLAVVAGTARHSGD